MSASTSQDTVVSEFMTTETATSAISTYRKWNAARPLRRKKRKTKIRNGKNSASVTLGQAHK